MSMSFVRADQISLIAFLVIVFSLLGALLIAVHATWARSSSHPQTRILKFALALLGWIALTSLVVESGVLERSPMPALPLFFFALNAVAIVFALSPIGKALSSGIPLQALVAFQSFRFPLELVLHAWALGGVIPETMTWSGQNFDVCAGLFAAIAAPFSARFRALAWSANLLGMLLLMNVIRVAVMSSPLPFAWSVEPPLQLVFHLPYAWVGSVCVAGALAGHVILTRALLLDRR